jgi:low affinity Fe/Cu permease
MQEYFRQFARVASIAAGSAWAFWMAVSIVLIWGVTGPIFRYSDTWQLVINTGTTIITFLMVFLIQNAQNRDGKAVQLKLDEIIRALKNARNELIDLETLSDEQLTKLQQEFTRLRAKCDSEQPHAPRPHHREDQAATESPS